MDIILKQDVDKLGYRDDLVSVRPGYANNFLIPQGFAIQATTTNKKIHAENLKQRAFKEEKLKKDALVILAKLESLSIKVGAKTSTNGKIFGSVNNIQLAEALAKEGVNIERKTILIKEEHIKEVGSYQAEIRLHRDVRATLNFEVVAE